MIRSTTAALLVAAAAGCTTAPPPLASPPAPEQPSVTAYPTVPPDLGPAPEFSLPEPTERTLANGLRVIYVPWGDLPLVQAVLITRGGMMDDPARLPGLASFTAEMLDEGAAGMSALELAESIEQLGASLSTSTSWDVAQVSLQVLTSQLPDALQLMADVTIRPDFPDAELLRVREERLTTLARARDNPGTVAANAFSALVFGADHPYGRLATQEAVGRIDRSTVAEFHERHYRPGVSTLVLAGAVDESLHAQVEEAFGGWARGDDVPAASVPGPPTVPATRIVLVDKPGAAQSEIRIGHPAVARDTEDFYALQVLNTLLGGSFTSRLNQNLRETHGYTYGAGSGFGMRLGIGPFTAGAAVVTEKTDSALVEFFSELNRIRDEAVPMDELERAKQYVALRLPQQFETSGQIAGRMAELATYDLPLAWYDDYVREIMAVTSQDVQRAAQQHVRPGRSVVVVVGDRQVIEPGLAALPFGPVDIREVEEFAR